MPQRVGDVTAPRASAPPALGGLPTRDSTNPFRAFQRQLAVDAFAAANGMSHGRRGELIEATDAAVAAVAGTGFEVTPFARADELSAALGFSEDGGVWIKDETSNVGGSHKARHLFTILLHLLAVESLGSAPWAQGDRPPLAISSCGNAAIAASTLAAAVGWPIRVFVPPWAAASVTDVLDSLGATVQRCPRLPDDPPGDPCVHRFRAAVAAGAIPFSVQGPENAWCLDGGRTIGWEMVRQFETVGGPPLDRIFVQVGGGAFAACVGAAFSMGGQRPTFHAVQTEGCAPLARAWDLAQALPDGVRSAARHWPELMWPWEDEPRSAADGILDDETYDWLGIFDAMYASGGAPIVAEETDVLAAHRLASEHTTIPVSATGTAGLAGVLARRSDLAPDERIAVVFSGVAR
ncbi:MAG: PLP-dependent lyase/thiolase [Ilumatobacteraceae bacterium]